MIVLHSKKCTILRVPKNGSTSLEASVRLVVPILDTDHASALEDINAPPRGKGVEISKLRQQQGIREEAERIRNLERLQDYDSISLAHSSLQGLCDIYNVISEKQIHSYTHYLTLRNPFSRVLSGYLFTTPSRLISFSHFREMILTEDFIGQEFRPQIDYFRFNNKILPNVQPILFDSYSKDVTELITKLSGIKIQLVPHLKQGEHIKKSFNASIDTWIRPYPKIIEAIRLRYAEDIRIWEQFAKREAV